MRAEAYRDLVVHVVSARAIRALLERRSRRISSTSKRAAARRESEVVAAASAFLINTPRSRHLPVALTKGSLISHLWVART